MPADDERRISRRENLLETITLAQSREDVNVVPRRCVAEQHSADAVDIERQRGRPTLDCAFVIRTQLRCIPANDFAKLLGKLRRLDRFLLRRDDAITISTNESHGNVEAEQNIETLDCERAGKYIATDDDLIHAMRADLTQHSLERRKIPVNVVKRCYTHYSADSRRVNG
jgi:hypothetical protein